MFWQIPRRMPFLETETALPCVLGRRAGFPQSVAPKSDSSALRYHRVTPIIQLLSEARLGTTCAVEFPAVGHLQMVDYRAR